MTKQMFTAIQMKKSKDWVIVLIPPISGVSFYGPYDSKSEVMDGIKGLKRFFREYKTDGL